MNPYRRVGKTIFVPNTIKTKFKSDLWVRSKDIARRCITDHEPGDEITKLLDGS